MSDEPSEATEPVKARARWRPAHPGPGRRGPAPPPGSRIVGARSCRSTWRCSSTSVTVTRSCRCRCRHRAAPVPLLRARRAVDHRADHDDRRARRRASPSPTTPASPAASPPRSTRPPRPARPATYGLVLAESGSPIWADGRRPGAGGVLGRRRGGSAVGRAGRPCGWPVGDDDHPAAADHGRLLDRVKDNQGVAVITDRWSLCRS